MIVRVQRLALAQVFLLLFAAYAHAQATSTITGVVTDSGGAIVPGATVVVTSNATSTKTEAITNGAGVFTVPVLPVGVYTVTVSLEGFKTAEVTDVRLQPGIPTTVRATLEIGTLAETVTVTGASAELINTQTATVAATLNSDQIAQIPTPTRDLLLNAVTYLVGVNSATTSRGNATVNGLPESFLNISLDGVSNNDNFNKSTDSFFAPVRPRQDAIEAVTVVSASGGADVGGGGAITINFVTRQGTNKFLGSAYEYYRHPNLNSNYWFNTRDGLEKNDVRLNQFGVRQGGPIIIPGLYDGRGKAFFFFHDEELRLPNNSSRNRTLLHPRALDGWFRYTAAGGTREVNVLDLARANGQIATTDPLVMRTLNNIQSAVQTTGAVTDSSDPLLRTYSWLSPANQIEHQPAVRIDYNVNANHRVTGTFNKLWQYRDPDQLNEFDNRWPGSPNYAKTVARRPQRSLALRSTLTQSLVSELRVGITRGERINFGQGAEDGGPESFADTSGYAIDFDANIGLTNWHTRNALSGRSAYQYTVDETLTWLKGNHSITYGGSAFLGRAWDDNQQQVTGINLRFDTTNDPAAALFNATNFAGASAAQLTDARELYALLTGRVGAVTGQAALDPDTNQYTLNGKRRRAGKLNNYAAFIQDSWRLTPTVTVNAGLRYDVQTPFEPVNDTMSAATLASVCGISGIGDGSIYNACNFYNPGNRGVVPEFVQFTQGTRGYDIDWDNFSPNVGVAWRPNVQNGWLATLLGDPEQATIRGGYSEAFNREGFGVFTAVFGANPGSTLSLSRDVNTGLVGPGESWPVLLRESGRIFNSGFPQTASFPIAIRPNRADNIEAFHPGIEVPHARTWTLGLQRAIGKNMAAEIRYVGTRGDDQWSELNYNELNVVENGFFNEFKLAMANLVANNTAGGGRAGSFAYFGPGTGTNPLPIYLAYINARADATNSGAYTGTTWTNTALTQDLVRTNPLPRSSAADLDGDATRRANAAAVGLPANFFVVNPHANQVNVTDSGAFSNFHALQLELRRRYANGFSFNANYQYAYEDTSAFLGFHYGRETNPSPNVRHALKAQWDWQLPIGRGERFGSNLGPVLNTLLGGWQFNGATRIQARMMNLSLNVPVRLVGMTLSDLQKMYKYDLRVNPDNGLLTPFMLPEDVILNTRRAFNTSPTSATGYSDLGVPVGRYLAPINSADCIELKNPGGDCAPRTLLVRAPWFHRVDLGVTKRLPIKGRMNFELRVDVLNVFDSANFNPVVQPAAAGGATIFQVTTAYRDPDNSFDPGGRIGQLGFRINW
jgi:hypothetical protein